MTTDGETSNPQKLAVETGTNAFLISASEDSLLLGIKLPPCPHPKGTMLSISLAPEGIESAALRGICCDGLCWSN